MNMSEQTSYRHTIQVIIRGVASTRLPRNELRKHQLLLASPLLKPTDPVPSTGVMARSYNNTQCHNWNKQGYN